MYGKPLCSLHGVFYVFKLVQPSTGAAEIALYQPPRTPSTCDPQVISRCSRVSLTPVLPAWSCAGSAVSPWEMAVSVMPKTNHTFMFTTVEMLRPFCPGSQLKGSRAGPELSRPRGCEASSRLLLVTMRCVTDT